MKSRRRNGFTLIETLTTVAFLVIVLGLMVSLAHHVRDASAEELTRDILRGLDDAMANYVRHNDTIPPVPEFITPGAPLPTEPALQRFAEGNNKAFVLALKSEGLLTGGVFSNLSIAYFDEVHVRDAWGSPIVFMSQMNPVIGMNPKGWFFFSAGPDRQYLTREDNLYSYDQPAFQP
jgi:type II secretory pathway pseudopilin PulG